jgi:hypothetical protein
MHCAVEAELYKHRRAKLKRHCTTRSLQTQLFWIMHWFSFIVIYMPSWEPSRDQWEGSSRHQGKQKVLSLLNLTNTFLLVPVFFIMQVCDYNLVIKNPSITAFFKRTKIHGDKLLIRICGCKQAEVAFIKAWQHRTPTVYKPDKKLAPSTFPTKIKSWLLIMHATR